MATEALRSTLRLQGLIWETLVIPARSYPLRLLDLVMNSDLERQVLQFELLSAPPCVCDTLALTVRKRWPSVSQLCSDDCEQSLTLLLQQVVGTTHSTRAIA